MKKFLLLITTLLVSLSNLSAQAEEPSLSAQEVLISNQSYMDITIFVSLKKNRWKKIKMKAEEWVIYQVAKAPALMKITTPGLGSTTVVHRLEGGKKYDIFWYAAKRRLDVNAFRVHFP